VQPLTPKACRRSSEGYGGVAASSSYSSPIWKSTVLLIAIAAALVAALFLWILPSNAYAGNDPGGGGGWPACAAYSLGWWYQSPYTGTWFVCTRTPSYYYYWQPV